MSQQALVVPDNKSTTFTLIEKPIPVPGTNEVLIKVEGVGLNPFEWKAPYVPPMFNCFEFPAYLGTDGAGIIEDVGSDVTKFKKGDRVLFQGWFASDYSTYQQYALAPDSFVAKLPSSISTLEASSIPLALITAANGFCLPNPAPASCTEIGKKFDCPLFLNGRAGAGMKPFWEDDAQGLQTGKVILILGGSSTVGQLAIQISKHLGYSAIITTSSLTHAEHLKSLGATHVLDRNTPVNELVLTIRDIIGQDKLHAFELAWDAVGAITQEYIDLLAPGGGFILANPQALKPEFSFKDGRRAIMPNGGAHAFKEQGMALFEKLGGLLEAGVIKPVRVEKIPGGLKGILDGHEKMRKNQVSGVKLVVDPTETA
ncbi:hypothetical protein PM082_013614 [Marasmius tenuissimus]|nr:hypothetical protein PM082_013614 [Marasmius tenuissimus]